MRALGVGPRVLVSALGVASRRLAALLVTLAALAVALTPCTGSAAAHSRPKVSFDKIENELMCVACHESLAVANSPEAYSERQYVRDLIAQGLDERQILRQMAAVYSPAVLGRPPARGFGLLVYILPPAVVAIGLAILFFVLPRWRRRTRERLAQSESGVPSLDPREARRLEEDLARVDP